MTPAPLPAPAPSPTTVVIDYQNVHLTAAGLFGGNTRRIRDKLIDPVVFAQQLIATRNAVTDSSTNAGVLTEVIVHRGLPSLEYDPQAHHGNLLAGQGWLDTAKRLGVNLTICHSPLTYHLIRPTFTEAGNTETGNTESDSAEPNGDAVNGVTDLAALATEAVTVAPAPAVAPTATPIARGREKGVDVRCALDLVAAAARGTKRGLVILASSDRDLTPALETAAAMRAARVEATAWDSRRPLQPEGLRLWTTFLDEQAFEASIDPRAARYHRNAATLAAAGTQSTYCSHHATIQTYSRTTGLQT